jgi:hypothetical protein
VDCQRKNTAISIRDCRIWNGSMESLPRKSESPSHAAATNQALAPSEAGFGASVAGAAQTHARAVSRRLPQGIAAAIAHTLFAVLIVIDVIRTLHHPMWRDEFQTYSIGLYSSSFRNLLINMWGFAIPRCFIYWSR